MSFKARDNTVMLKDKRILLIISGGIAAYKTLELIRLLKKSDADVRCILTKGGAQFVTPLSVAALSQNKVYSDLWSLTDETEMGHIRLSRESDLIVVAPASADLMTKMAHGLADDLASTTLLASGKPVLIAPAMNPEMWAHPATQANLKILNKRSILQVGPNDGDMACGETGSGRMSEPDQIFTAITDFFFDKPLNGYKALVTSGPTYEPLDPVRFLGNRSSGKQGHAIAKALRDAGAEVTLISGPVHLPDPAGIDTIHVETAQEMFDACSNALPIHIAVCAAAVSDWTPARPQTQKIKKTDKNHAPDFALKQNPDILKMIATHPAHRPDLVIGFAAETHDLETHAKDKLARKGCDWMIANAVGPDERGAEKTFGADQNQIYFISQEETEEWERADKKMIARKLVNYIINHVSDDGR